MDIKKILLIPLLLFLLTGCSTVAVSSSFNDKVNLTESGSVPTESTDYVGRKGLNTVFGDTIVGHRVPQFSAQFQYGLNTENFESTLVNTGSVDFDESMLNLHTGTNANGSVIVESTNFLRYLPGHEVQGLFTAVFSPESNVIQKAGIFDEINGFYFKWNGTNFQSCRLRESVEFCDNINTSNVFGEGIDLNVSNGNIYSISYGYLGFAPISFGVMTPEGRWTLLNQIEYPNSNPLTHVTQSHLPLRAENTNVGSTTDSTLSFGSLWAGIVDGDIVPGTYSDPTARFFTRESTIKSGSSGNVFAFRSKSTYNGKENRVQSLLKLVSCSTDGNKPVRFKLLKNPQYLSATWANVSVDSVLEVSDDLVLNVSAEDGDAFLYWDMAKSDAFFQDVAAQNLLLPPTGVAVFYFESTQTTEAQCSIRWAELF